ncbi:hypothetical protein B0H14DRAFT_2615871 [Mycena olivaceomarginata]|nr:hypothetical protein B0H14DRAFT_2615871 [Mycena olivaceomarginata]
MDVPESGKGPKGEREEVCGIEQCIGIMERAGPGGQDLGGMSPQHRETVPQARAGSRVVADRTKTWMEKKKIGNLMRHPDGLPDVVEFASDCKCRQMAEPGITKMCRNAR